MNTISSAHGLDGIVVLGTLEMPIRDAIEAGYLAPVEGDPLSFAVLDLPGEFRGSARHVTVKTQG